MAGDEVGTLEPEATVLAILVAIDPPTTSMNRIQIDQRHRHSEQIIRIVTVTNSGRCRKLILECILVLLTSLMIRTHMS